MEARVKAGSGFLATLVRKGNTQPFIDHLHSQILICLTTLLRRERPHSQSSQTDVPHKPQTRAFSVLVLLTHGRLQPWTEAPPADEEANQTG